MLLSRPEGLLVMNYAAHRSRLGADRRSGENPTYLCRRCVNPDRQDGSRTKRVRPGAPPGADTATGGDYFSA